LEALRDSLDLQVDALADELGAGPRLVAQSWFARHEFFGPASTNQDSHDLPFQRWYRFKEAFAPRAVVEAFSALPVRPQTCIDPFGGSGTTSLTAQFLGVRPTTVEVNPFLADLIEAKLTTYLPNRLIRAFRAVVDAAANMEPDPSVILAAAPPTFVEPGVAGRWIFNRDVAVRILAYRLAIEGLEDATHRRLLRVLLGSALITLSNVVISGKGRRYRSGWTRRAVRPFEVGRLFEAAVLRAIEDIVRFGRRACREFTLLRGDARTALAQSGSVDFALFSPPYPNSFDYTDIYNIELWMLGYLRTGSDNRALREATLRSHVQINRSFDSAAASPLLTQTIDLLNARRELLWNARIPQMVSAYFDDITGVLRGLHRLMPAGGSVMMVVGDSQYAGVPIDVAAICAEMADGCGFALKGLSQMRSMRSSAQQGGSYELGETLVHLTCE
jgi:hypothetical protein